MKDIKDDDLKSLIAKAMDCTRWNDRMWAIVDLVADNDDQMSTEQAVALGILLSQHVAASE